MPVSGEFIRLIEEALAPLGSVKARRMFSGAGLYSGSVMFALIADDTLYLKADDATRTAFEAEGLGPFVYQGKGKPVRMSYWQAPQRLLDDPDELLAWAERALEAAHRAARSKSVRAEATRAKSTTKPKEASETTDAGRARSTTPRR